MLLACTLLLVELINGMQSFVARAVLPVLGADLNAHQFYGLITGVGGAAMFFTMPLGPWLIRRFTAAKLMLYLTAFNIIGGVVSAYAVGGGSFLLGRVIAGLAGGALAAVSLSAIFSDLPPFWRRFTLAGYNVMWLIISFAGPVYSTWVTTRLSWRWAYLLYLPFLAAGRFLMAWQLKGSVQTAQKEPLKVKWALMLTAGVMAMSMVGFGNLAFGFQIALGLLGIAVTLVAARALLLAGTVTAASGRPAAVATMGVVTAVYFGAAAFVGIIVHDLLGGTITQVSVVLGGSTVAWSIAGLAVSKWPPASSIKYANRVKIGALLLAGGLSLIGLSLVRSVVLDAINWAFAGWLLSGVGMGLIYLDTMNFIAGIPMEADGVSPAAAASSTVMVEAIAPAITGTLAAAIIGQAIDRGYGNRAALTILVVLAFTALVLIVTSRRAAQQVIPLAVEV